MKPNVNQSTSAAKRVKKLYEWCDVTEFIYSSTVLKENCKVCTLLICLFWCSELPPHSKCKTLPQIQLQLTTLTPTNVFFRHIITSAKVRYWILNKTSHCADTWWALNQKFYCVFKLMYSNLLLTGLLCGDLVPSWDGHSGSPYPPNPSVVPEGHLPSRICPQRSGPDEGQVSK